MLKILHAYKLYLPFKGGIQSIIREVIQGLANKIEFEVLVARAPGQNKIDKIDNATVYRTFSLGTILALPLAPFYIFRFWLKARKVDVVDFHYPFPLVDLAVSLWFPRKTALVIHWHSEIIAQKKTLKMVTPFIKRCLNRADKIIIASPKHIDYSSLLTTHRNKCAIVPFGVDTSYWRMMSSVEIHRVGEFKFQHPRMVLTVGRLVSYKGFAVLIKAMVTVNAELIIVGSGPLYESLSQLVKHLSLSKKVHFYGEITDSTLKCLYHACDVFVLPSVFANEAFGVTQLEAMSCGKPVVNTRLKSAVPWVARDGKEAISVPQNDSTLLAEAINGLLDDMNKAVTLGNNGIRRVKDLFCVENFLNLTNRVYEEAAAKRRIMATKQYLTVSSV